MTRDELLEAIDREIEHQNFLFSLTKDEKRECYLAGGVVSLQWVRGLVEKPPGRP